MFTLHINQIAQFFNINIDKFVMTSVSHKPPNSNIITTAILDIFPLSVSVIPWGILCGTLGVQAGLSPLQSQLMSLLIFAGSAQLAGIAIFNAGLGWVSLINSNVMVNIRHLLYSATFKTYVTPLSLWQRLVFAFLLTDEMFVVTEAYIKKTGKFNYRYAVAAGLFFYSVWNIATFIGIFAAQRFKNIDQLGFDFAIAATFIAMVMPMIKSKAILTAVMVSAMVAFICHIMVMNNGLLVATLMGMIAGAFVNAKHKKISKKAVVNGDGL